MNLFKLFFLLFVLFVATFADSPLCRILKSVAQPPPVRADGLTDWMPWDDIGKWIAGDDCDNLGESFDYDSGLVLPSGHISSAIEGISFSGGYIERVVHARYDPSTELASVYVHLSTVIPVCHDTAPSVFVNINVSMGFNIAGIPLSLAGRYDPIWHGEIVTVTPDASLVVLDADIFDGHPAIVFLNRYGSATSDALSHVDEILSLAADANLRLVHFDSVPTVIGEDISARLGFMGPSSLPPSSAEKSYGQTDMLYSVAWNGAECIGNDCDSSIVNTLTEFAAADSICSNPTVIPESIHGRLWTTMLINSTSAQLHSAHAMSKAIFHCSGDGKDGYLSIALEAISTNDTSDHPIDVKTFLSDKRAAVLMMKNGGFKLRGHRTGYVKAGDVVYTASRDDMFGPGYGGVFYTDYPLAENGKEQFVSFYYAFLPDLAGTDEVINASVRVIFDNSNPERIYDNYVARTSVQTQYNLLAYFVSLYDGLTLVKSDDKDATVSIAANIHSHLGSYILEYVNGIKTRVALYFDNMVKDIINRCGFLCWGFSDLPTMDSTKFAMGRSYLVIDGYIDVTLKPTGLDDSCLAILPHYYRSASFYAPLTISKNDVLWAADLNYTTDPHSVVFSNIKTNDLPRIPNQIAFYSHTLGTIFDDGLGSDTLQSLQENLLKIADDIYGEEDRMEPSLTTLVEGLSDRTLSNAIRHGAQAIATGDDGSVLTSFVLPFRQAFMTFLDGAFSPFGAFDIAFQDDKGVAKFHFGTVPKVTPSVSGAHWCRILDVTRAPIAVPLTWNLDFDTENGISTFSIFGTAQKNVILPVRDGMRVGHLDSANVYVSVDYPRTATYSLTMSGNIQRGNTVTGKFVTNLLSTDTTTSEYPYSFDIEEADNGYYNNGAEPEEVMAAFVGILKSPEDISVHRLAAPLAPLAKALSEIVNLGDEWEEKAQWVYSIAPFAVLARSMEIYTPTMMDYSQQITFTLNNRTYGPCSISVPKDSRYPQVVSSISYSLSSCGLLDYVTPKFQSVSSDGTSGDSGVGSVLLYPRFPGSIYSFTIDTNDDIDNLFTLQNWHEAEHIPDFLSWNDMYKLVYAAFLRSEGYTFTLPVMTTVSTEKLVPESRRAFYPSVFNAVYFPAKASITRHAKNVPLQTEFHSSDDASVDGNGVSIKIPEGSVVPDVEVTADVELMFGVSFWCALGDGTLTMGTGFDDSCLDRTLGFAKVENAPNNTFVFSAVIEKRSSLNPNAVPELIKYSQQITLVPGKLVGESLIKDMPGQLDPLIAQMTNITLDGDGFCADMASILMIMSTLEDGTDLYVPLKIQITDSRIVAVGTGSESPATIQAVTACPITSDMVVGIDVKLHDYEEEDKKVLKNIPCTGSVGILGLSECKVDIEGRHILSASNRMQDSMIHEMRGAVVNRKIFDEFYENGIDFDTKVTMHDFAFDVSHNSDLRKEKIVLSKVGTTPVTSSKDYSLSAFSARATTPALNGLIHTSQEDFCRGVEVSQSVAHSFVSKDEMKQNIPFTEQSFAPVYTSLVEEPFRSVHRALCEKRLRRETVTTTSEFCNAIKRHWAFVYRTAPTSVPDICGSITLDEEGLVLPLSVKFANRPASAPFLFNASRVGSRDIVMNGYGPNGNMDLALDAEATFGIKFGFGVPTSESKRGPVTLDKTASKMMMSATAIPKKFIRAAAGSIVLDIDASDVDVSTKVVSEFTEDIKHTKEMKRDIYDWQVEDKSLLLRDGANERVRAVMSGKAYLGAIVSNSDTIGQWSMKINVPQVSDFYSPAPAVNDRGTMYDTVQFSTSCINGKKNDGGLLKSIADAADFSTLAKYFESDPDLFSAQMIKNITHDLVDILVDEVTNQAIGFLGKHIQELTHKVFDDIIGDNVATEIGNDIKYIVEKIIKNSTYPNPTDLEREVLKIFSGYLNEVFKDYLVSPINTPEIDPKDPKYVWNMRFGQTKQIAATNIDWSLGEHGYADLEVAAGITVTMAWTASFDVVWTKDKGISIDWPVNPAFSATITADGSNLEISGSFLFVAADIVGTFNAQGKLSGNPFKQDIQFKLDSSLKANGKLGLVGLLRQLTAEEKKNSIQTLPYVTSDIEASWSFTYGVGDQRPSTPASWKFVKPQLCLGSLFTEFMRKATHEIDRVVKPLEPIFGSDGILLKPIPGLSTLFGKKCNALSVLEVVCELFSSRTCNVNAVHNIIHVVSTIAEDIAKLQQFEEWLKDPYGCNDLMLVYSTFSVNWTKDNPTPEKDSGADPTNEKGALVFGPGISDEQKEAFTEYYTKWNGGVPPCIEPDLSYTDDEDESKFGIQLDILKDFPSKFLRMILGDNVELLSVHFPEVSFAFGYDWSIPIYPFPYIAVVIGFQACVSFQPPTMILTSNSLVDTISTGNPSYLFRDVGIATNMSFVRGSIEIAGGVEGGISVVIFKVTVSFEVYLQFNAAAKVTSVTGRDFETIDSIGIQMRQYGFFGVIDFDLNLKAGVRISLRACINLFLFKKCWTLVSWQADAKLWEWRPAKDKIPDIAPYNGQIDGKHVDFIYDFDKDPLDDEGYYGVENRTMRDAADKPTYFIGVNSVMLLPKGGHEANAALTKGVEGEQTVQWQSGSECGSGAYKVIVAGDSPRQNTVLPSCADAEIEIYQNGYHEATKFQISKTSVLPDSRPGVTLGSQSSGVYLSKPDYGVSYEFVGAPAYSFKLDGTEASKATFTGESSEYSGSTVEITTKIDRINFDVNCQSFNYESNEIVCDGLHVKVADGTPVYRNDQRI